MSRSVTVVGTGYVGLVTGACLAELGHRVLCLDVDEVRIERLQRGIVPIYEPGLEELVSRNLSAGKLQFTTDVVEAVRHGDFQMIAVGTPQAEDGSANVSFVYTAARNIGAHITRPVTVIDKSTVPVGTGDRVRALVNVELERRGLEMVIDLVSNPEFLKEGAAIDDFMHPDRIVIGSDTESGTAAMRELYAPLINESDRLVITDVRSAELTKYAANAMLATRISLMNELATLSDRVGANIDDVKRGIGSDARIGSKFLNAGAGYGGSCFPKDVQALIHTARENGLAGMSILESVERVNDDQKTYLLDRLEEDFTDVSGLTVAVWGLAFKPNTSDVRDATSVSVIARLVNQAAKVRAFDPVAMEEFHTSTQFPSVVFADSAVDALTGADVLMILTEWAEFQAIDPREFSQRLRLKRVYDGRNIYSLEHMAKSGVTYTSIGRPTVSPQGSDQSKAG